MKRLVTAVLLLTSLNACGSKTPVMNNMMLPQQAPLVNTFNNNEEGIARLVDKLTTVINKSKAVQGLSDNVISVDKADVFDKKNVFRIDFPEADSGVIGFIRMFLRPDGVSELQVVGNFYRNIPVSLSKSETAKILKSAKNYSEHASKLNKILAR